MNGSTATGERFSRSFNVGVILAVVALLSACGGGGGGGVDVTPPETNLEYIFGPPRGGVGPLTVTGAQSRFILSQSSDGPWMSGTFDTSTFDATIADNAAVPILWPDTATPTAGALFGDLSITVTRTFRWNDGDDPTDGELLIMARDEFFPGTIKLRVLAGGAGVRTEYDSGNDGTYEEAASYSWGSFYDLWADDLKPTFERVSSFVYYMRQGVFSLIDLSMQTVIAIEDNRAALEAVGSGNAVRVECDSLPGGTNQPGYYDIVWTDVNHDGRIDNTAVDTFSVTLNQCWTDDPSDPEDLLLDGVLRLAYYESHLQWEPVFESFVMTRTLDNVVVPGSAKTVNGGFSFLIPGF